VSHVSGVCWEHHQHIINKQSLCFSTTTIHGDHLLPCPPTTTSRKHHSTTANRHGTHQRHQQQQIQCHDARSPPAGSTPHRGDNVARQRFLPEVPQRVTVVTHAAAATTMTNDNGWGVREEGELP
jgi:hypothetical protein